MKIYFEYDHDELDLVNQILNAALIILGDKAKRPDRNPNAEVWQHSYLETKDHKRRKRNKRRY